MRIGVQPGFLCKLLVQVCFAAGVYSGLYMVILVISYKEKKYPVLITRYYKVYPNPSLLSKPPQLVTYRTNLCLWHP
jgi:hypothetical protein